MSKIAKTNKQIAIDKLNCLISYLNTYDAQRKLSLQFCIIDDLLVKIFCLLDLRSIATVSNINQHFYNIITNNQNKYGIMNRHWQNICQYLYYERYEAINPNYKTHQWYQFFLELLRLNPSLRTSLQKQCKEGKFDKDGKYMQAAESFCPGTAEFLRIFRRISLSPITLACQNDCPIIFNMYVSQNKAVVNDSIKDMNGYVPPLYLSCTCGSVNMVRYLLNQPNIDINIRHCGGTKSAPLLEACYYGFYEIVELLLSHDKMTTQTINYISPKYQIHVLHHALFFNKNSPGTHSASQSTPNTEFDSRTADLLIRKGNIDVNAKICGIGVQSATSTALHFAITYYNNQQSVYFLDVIKYLLHDCHDKIDVNVTDTFGQTPLDRATRYNQQDVIKMLVDRNCNISHT